MGDKTEKMYRKAEELLKKHHDKNCSISLQELITYISAPTYTGDQTTTEEIFSDIYLTYHELVEICELKKMGIKITKNVILEHPKECYIAHYIALKRELELAKENRETARIKRRLENIKSYLADPNVPRELESIFIKLLKTYENFT
ncbi:MAG: hypothetical protein ACP6IP_03800 [Candidatus Njordarchaeia archaeon]